MLIKLPLCFLLLVSVIGCAPVDPSVRDLKSPCVANEFDYESSSQLVPCIKRSPLENIIV